MGVQGWGCIDLATIRWFRETSEKLIEEDGKALPGFAFFHIPLVEYLDMWHNTPTYGLQNEPILCSSVNTGIFA